MNLISIILIFLTATMLSAFINKEKQIRYFSLFAAMLGTALVFSLTLPVLFGFSQSWSTQLVLVDSFSALIASLVAFLYAMVTIVSVRYIGHEFSEGIIGRNDVRLYFALLHLFALSMLVTVLTNNILLLWIALEGTTLSSTFLVGLYRKKSSVEAAWKYIIICSTGISLGLIGILLLSYGLRLSGTTGMEMFLLTSLMEKAPLLQAGSVKLAFVFLFVGFGAKVGLAPMHTWLPDAHSKAPSPISAFFSGILLNVALYAIMRFAFVADGALQSDWTRNFFLFFGVISIVLSALMLLVQTNYKRMLAYSSIEHMGLISIALAFPPLGALAAIIHMVGHTLIKSLLFFGAGEILLKFKTTKVEKLSGVFAHDRYTAIFFLLGILAIIAMPPSALFMSEYMLFVGVLMQKPILAIFLFICLSVIAYGMLRLTMTMLFLNKDGGKTQKHKWTVSHSVMLLQLVLVICFALWVTTESGLDFVQQIVNSAIYISHK